MECCLCGISEFAVCFKLRKRKLVIINEKEVRKIICSRCVQGLLRTSQEHKNKAYTKSLERGMPEKAKAIQLFINQEELNASKTELFRPGISRGRSVRNLPSADQRKYRSKHRIKPLGKRRTSIR
jgi:hypothetical protein